MSHKLLNKKAPGFKALNQDGKYLDLKDFKGSTVILYFYPKDLTSGCTQQAIDFKDNFLKFKRKKTIIIGVSKDSQASHVKFITKYDLPFDLISDEDLKVCKLYDVWKEKSMYGRKYMGVMRSTFISGPDQKILNVFEKVKVKAHADEILKTILT